MISIIARELGGPLRMAGLVEEAQRLGTVDPLTGLLNRRAFLASFAIEVERSMRVGYPVSVVLMDIDHFKAINDTHGHAGGDVVLAALGRLLASEARRSDLVARWGGEEFILLLSGADEQTGVAAGRGAAPQDRRPPGAGGRQAHPGDGVPGVGPDGARRGARQLHRSRGSSHVRGQDRRDGTGSSWRPRPASARARRPSTSPGA